MRENYYKYKNEGNECTINREGNSRTTIALNTYHIEEDEEE